MNLVSGCCAPRKQRVTARQPRTAALKTWLCFVLGDEAG